MKKLLLFVCLATLFACKKDNKQAPPIIEEGTYESDGKVYGSSITMFTGNGSIHDTTIINTYIRRKWTISPFYAGTDHDTLGYRQTLIFKGNAVTAKNNLNAETTMYDVVRKTENIFWLVERDSVTVVGKNPGTLSCDNIAMKIRQNQIAYNCQPIPGGANYCKTKNRWPFAKATGYFSRPVMRYTFERTTAGSTCGFSEIDIPDFFNGAVMDELQPGDTLLVQEAGWFLNKK